MITYSTKTPVKSLFKYIVIAFALLCTFACRGMKDDSAVVPDGVLRVFADKSEIKADGVEEVTFRVMFGSQDVTAETTCTLIRTFDGNQNYMAGGVNKFSTTAPGTYTFKARYYYAGAHYSDNEVEVVATPYFTGDEENYLQRVLGVYFTSTGCTSCPTASKGIANLQQAYPGVISIVAFHDDMVVDDPMKIEEIAVFKAAFGGFQGLPRLFWNMRAGTDIIGPVFTDSYLEELGQYTPSCGVAVSAAYDENTRKLDIELGIKSNIPASYRYLIFLVEDDVDGYEQAGVNGSYLHQNVIRDVLVKAASGEKINNGRPLPVGSEVKASKSVVLDQSWNADNMRVVVAAMLSSDGGFTFVADNVNECAVGSSASYLYAE